jgi:hypothetical protein
MTDRDLDTLLKRFRRDLLFANGVRWSVMAALFVCAFGVMVSDDEAFRRTALLSVIMILIGWTVLAGISFRHIRLTNLGAALIAADKLDDAEVNLRQVILRFSLFRNVKMMACHQLAVLSHSRHQYQQGSRICRELLRHRLGSLKTVGTSCRLLWADCLLRLDDVQGAYEAFLPMHGGALSLSEQLKLMPIQLRYELSAGLEKESVENLKEKVRLAELLDAKAAALVHALLAEACRRCDMVTESAYLSRRAALYGDLDDIAKQVQLIAPIAEAANQFKA